MSSFQAVFYRDGSGREPVRDFLESLDEDTLITDHPDAGRNHVGLAEQETLALL